MQWEISALDSWLKGQNVLMSQEMMEIKDSKEHSWDLREQQVPLVHICWAVTVSLLSLKRARLPWAKNRNAVFHGSLLSKGVLVPLHFHLFCTDLPFSLTVHPVGIFRARAWTFQKIYHLEFGSKFPLKKISRLLEQKIYWVYRCSIPYWTNKRGQAGPAETKQNTANVFVEMVYPGCHCCSSATRFLPWKHLPQLCFSSQKVWVCVWAPVGYTNMYVWAYRGQKSTLGVFPLVFLNLYFETSSFIGPRAHQSS